MTSDAILDWLHSQMMAIPNDILCQPYDDRLKAMARQKTLIEVRNWIWDREREELECERRNCICRRSSSEAPTSGTRC